MFTGAALIEILVQQKTFAGEGPNSFATPCGARCSTPVPNAMLSSLQIFRIFETVSAAAEESLWAKTARDRNSIRVSPGNKIFFMTPPEIWLMVPWAAGYAPIGLLIKMVPQLKGKVKSHPVPHGYLFSHNRSSSQRCSPLFMAASAKQGTAVKKSFVFFCFMLIYVQSN